MQWEAKALLKLGALAAAFLAAYLLLEWATYRSDVAPLGITPWNPTAGLSLALLLERGPRWAPLLALALLAADLSVRHVPFPWWVELAEVVVTVSSYAVAVALLRRPALGFDRRLATLRDLLLLVAATIASAVVVAIGYVGVLCVAGLLPASALVDAVLRHWAGDVIGILAVTPFVLLMLGGNRPPLTGETALQALAVLAAVAIVVGGEGGLRAQLFYILFLPVGWIAMREGLAGAAAGLFVMQIGLMIALHSRPSGSGEVVELQAVLLILLFAGLAIGVLTSERERVDARLRRQQALLARAARTAGMGSLSAGLAHEISQPLTAVVNYTRAANHALSADPPRLEQAREAVLKSAAQLARANDVVRKLRGLFEMNSIDLARRDGRELARECAALMAADAAEHGVEIELALSDERLEVLADATQIVLVLNNLVRNGLEAMEATPAALRRLSVGVAAAGPDRVSFKVSDAGTGFPPGFDLTTHGPGQSEKPHGLGVGLGLCRSIVEAHGGAMTVVSAAGGATVEFKLRRARGGEHAEAT